MHEIKLLIADDHAVVREGLKRILDLEPDIQVVGLARDGQEAIDLVRKLRPQVVLMDIRMPGIDGILATRYIKEAFPETAVIMLTMYDWDEYLFQAVNEGATGYILKDVPACEVVQAVRAGARGESLLHPGMARKLMEGFASLSHRRSSGFPPADGGSSLSSRELDVLRLLGAGLSNKAIAEKLFITERTVKKHVGEILRTLGVTSRTEAVITAVSRGLIRLEEEPAHR